MRIGRLPSVTLLLVAISSAAFAGPVEDGKKELADGRYQAAAQSFKKALEASASNRDALLGLAEATSEGRLGDAYEETAALLRAALKTKPDDRDLRLALARVYLAWSDVDDRWRADVQDQYQRLLAANPDDEDAVVGMARMYFAGADYGHGLSTLEEFLAKHPNAPAALYWKGQLLYDQATQAYATEKRITKDIEALFRRAFDAFDASTKADPKRLDAWLKLGYSAQYLTGGDESKRGVASAAYERALDLDGDGAHGELAMRGLSALFPGDARKWQETLVRIAKDHAKAPIVHWWYGYSLAQQGKTDEAEKEYRAYVGSSRFPANGWAELGKILAKRGDEAGARKAFEASLKADPRHAGANDAVDALAKPLYERMTPEVQASATKAKALLKDCLALMAIAPASLWLRNNVGVFFRDAYAKNGDEELLHASVKAYEEAAVLVGPWQPEYEEKLAYKDRHQMAQVLNDTGLMFQYHKPVEDLKKAEEYYRRAMEWSAFGYWDTYGNLIKLLEAQQRWQDAFDFATACAEGQKDEDGKPNETHRATARADAQRYEAKLPK